MQDWKFVIIGYDGIFLSDLRGMIVEGFSPEHPFYQGLEISGEGFSILISACVS